MNPIESFERAAQGTTKVIENVSRDQLSNPTPCPEWDVKTLINHMIGANIHFAGVAAGENQQFTGDTPDFTEGDFVTTFRESTEKMAKVFSEPGALDRTLKLQIGEMPGVFVIGIATTETALHGWDLAKATEQEPLIEDELASVLYRRVSSALTPELRGTAFGPPVEVSDDASPTDKLVAFLGRTP